MGIVEEEWGPFRIKRRQDRKLILASARLKVLSLEASGSQGEEILVIFMDTGTGEPSRFVRIDYEPGDLKHPFIWTSWFCESFAYTRSSVKERLRQLGFNPSVVDEVFPPRPEIEGEDSSSND